MTELLEIVEMYADKLERGYKAIRHATDENFILPAHRLEHIHWMCREILEKKMTNSKQHRWLGFIQGVLYSEGLFTIDEMKEHNK